MTVFQNIGLDMGIIILGLAFLKFFVLACGGCPFQGAVANIYSQGTWRGLYHLLVLSSMYCLQTVRMAIPGEGNGNPLQYACLENPTDRGAWWAIIHGATKSWTRLSDSQIHTSLSYFSKDENEINNIGATTDVFNTPNHWPLATSNFSLSCNWSVSFCFLPWGFL